MESRIGWLGGHFSKEASVEELLVSADPYTGEDEYDLTPEQKSTIRAHLQEESDLMDQLMEWGGFQTTEEAEAFLAAEAEAQKQ
jgi:hypothetical protein